jgi:DNA-binding NarL/FixJ family response regulator
VLVADARVLVRKGIMTLVSTHLADVRFVEAQAADEVMLAAGASRPAFALVDPALPGLDGGWGLPALARLCPCVPLVLLATECSAELLRQAAMTSTVCALVPMSATAEQLGAAMDAALTGYRLRIDVAALPVPDVRPAALSGRQDEIRALVRRGLSNKEIGRALGITEGTVKNHITRMLRTLKLTNRTQVAMLSFEGE